jgi:hypothetical protein
MWILLGELLSMTLVLQGDQSLFIIFSNTARMLIPRILPASHLSMLVLILLQRTVCRHCSEVAIKTQDKALTIASGQTVLMSNVRAHILAAHIFRTTIYTARISGIIKAPISAGADVSAIDCRHLTPLDCALRAGCDEMVRCLQSTIRDVQ